MADAAGAPTQKSEVVQRSKIQHVEARQKPQKPKIKALMYTWGCSLSLFLLSGSVIWPIRHLANVCFQFYTVVAFAGTRDVTPKSL